MQKFEVNQPKIEQVTRRQLLEGRIRRIEQHLEGATARETKAAAERDSQYISKLAALTAELNAL